MFGSNGGSDGGVVMVDGLVAGWFTVGGGVGADCD